MRIVNTNKHIKNNARWEDRTPGFKITRVIDGRVAPPRVEAWVCARRDVEIDVALVF